MKTKAQKLADYHTAYEAAKAGVKPKQGPKNRSLPTHPFMSVPDLPEAKVLEQCLKWLKARRVFCDRHDCGSGPGHARYGILGAGDIIGVLGGGRHFEIECKRGRGGRLSVVQQARMRDVRAAGGVYEVVHGVAELECVMERLR
jgi:hypothetical protein